MRPMHIENPILIWMVRERWKVGKICFALVVQTVLLLVICHLLWRAKLGRFADVIFLSEALLILLVAPYLACSALNQHLGCVPSAHLLLLSPMRSRNVVGGIILGSQLYSFCFLGFTWIVLGILIPAIRDISLFHVTLLHLVFGIYAVVGASVGAYGWHIFRNELFATELTHLIMVILIGEDTQGNPLVVNQYFLIDTGAQISAIDENTAQLFKKNCLYGVGASGARGEGLDVYEGVTPSVGISLKCGRNNEHEKSHIMNTNSELTEIKRIVQQNGDMLQRHGEVLQQHSDLLVQISKDQSYLRGALDQITERLSSLDARVNLLENRMSVVETRISEGESRLRGCVKS